jgi:hypothetical protein
MNRYKQVHKGSLKGYDLFDYDDTDYKEMFLGMVQLITDTLEEQGFNFLIDQVKPVKELSKEEKRKER